jgi:hypothetical protein
VLMTSPPEGLLGSQQPGLLVRPDRLGSSAEEAIGLAAEAGLILDPWQQLVLDAALGHRADGKWAAFEVGVVVPRQNGKGSILEARELAGLFLFGEELILHSAHEFKTAQEAFRRIKALIESSDELSKKVLRVRTANGDEGIELRNGSRLRFVARSAGSGRGFSGDCIILDEAYKLSPAMMAALLPTLSARPNPQLWYTTSSPPEVDEFSEQIRNTKQRAESPNPGRLAWCEWSNPAGVDPHDWQAIAESNPAIGIRIEPEFIEAERAAMPVEAFLVERLGVWRSTSLSSKIPMHLWEQRVTAESPSADGAVFAVDIPPERDGASIAVCDGVTFELARRSPGTEWVVAECIRLWDTYKPSAFVVDAIGPAAAIVPDLEEAGVTVVVTNTREFASACGRLFDGIVNDECRHTGQPDLTTAVAGAASRKLGDAWAWSRSTSAVDISPLVAVTLALWGATTLTAEKPAPVFAY